MSIIYDALQKTQKKRLSELTNKAPKALPWKSRWPMALSLFIGFSLSVVILYQGITHVAAYLSKKSVLEANAKKANAKMPTVAMLDQFKLEHQVNGVFLSNNEKLALIDNKPFHIGETVGGLKIMSMDLHQLKLQNVASAETVQLNIG